MNTAVALGQLRHVMTAVGPLVVGLGWMTEDEWGQFATALFTVVGAGITVVGFLWSAIEKKRRGSK